MVTQEQPLLLSKKTNQFRSISMLWIGFGCFLGGVGAVSRAVAPSFVDNLLGGSTNRGVFEHLIEAAAVTPIFSGLILHNLDGAYDLRATRISNTIAQALVVPFYVGFQLVWELTQAQANGRLQFEQLVGTAVGLTIGMSALALVRKLADRKFKPVKVNSSE